MFATVLLSTLVSAAAFAPSGRVVSSSSLKMAEPFAGGLAGNAGPELKNFDPLKFSTNSPEWVPFFREAELKHGRIAMLAVVGVVATSAGIRLPGDIYTSGNIIDAHNNAVTNGPMWQLLFWLSLIEIISSPAVAALGKGDRAPGDFSFDPLGLGKDPKKLETFKVNELKNGRLAMLAFSGIITQAVLYNKPEFPFF